MADTLYGRAKANYPVQSRLAITVADESRDLASFAPLSVDIGAQPYVDFWGDCSDFGSELTFAFVLFDENRKPLGCSSPRGLSAATYKIGDRVAGDFPDSIDVGSARRVAVIVLGVTLGTWNLYWRPYGIIRTPC